MSSISRLRRDGARPDFEFTEEHAVGSIHSTVENGDVHVPRGRRRRHAVAGAAPASVKAVPAEFSLMVSLAPLGPYQDVFRHMCLVLEGLPALKGSVLANADELTCLPLVQQYLQKTLCVHPEEREWISLDRLICSVNMEPGMRHASPAVVACAVVEMSLHDVRTWKACNMTKLNLWRVRACFWDFVYPLTGFGRTIVGHLHFRLADAVRHIQLGTVIAHGYMHILPIIEGYVALLQSSKTFITKEAQDVLESVFLVKSNLVLLQHAVLSDMLDGLGFPAPTQSPSPVRWTLALETATLPEAPPRVDRLLFEDIFSIAERYCWMFVAAHHIVFPSHSIPTLPSTWENAMIQWPDCISS